MFVFVTYKRFLGVDNISTRRMETSLFGVYQYRRGGWNLLSEDSISGGGFTGSFYPAGEMETSLFGVYQYRRGGWNLLSEDSISGGGFIGCFHPAVADGNLLLGSCKMRRGGLTVARVNSGK